MPALKVGTVVFMAILLTAGCFGYPIRRDRVRKSVGEIVLRDGLLVDRQVVPDLKPRLFVFCPDVGPHLRRRGVVETVCRDVDFARSFVVFIANGRTTIATDTARYPGRGPVPMHLTLCRSKRVSRVRCPGDDRRAGSALATLAVAKTGEGLGATHLKPDISTKAAALNRVHAHDPPCAKNSTSPVSIEYSAPTILSLPSLMSCSRMSEPRESCPTDACMLARTAAAVSVA